MHKFRQPISVRLRLRFLGRHLICLHFFRHLAQKPLDIRQYACGISIQSDDRQAAGPELLFERHELPEVYISPKTKSGAEALRQAAGPESLLSVSVRLFTWLSIRRRRISELHSLEEEYKKGNAKITIYNEKKRVIIVIEMFHYEVTLMDKDAKIVKLKLDIIFKRVFGNANNERIIAAFVSDLLDIPRESIKAIYINNVELTPEYYSQKFSRLDLKLNVDGRIVNIEMQVNSEPDFKERTLFYWSKLYSDELNTGEEYAALKQTICVNIINFNLFDCEDYHSHFRILENERGELLTDKFAIHFFELKKLKRSGKNKRMEDWLNLINAETEGDLMEIQDSTNIPEVKDTIVMLRQLNADEKVKQEAYYREKRLHDEASALNNAKREGEAKGRAEGQAELKESIVEKKKKNGFTEEQIRLALGDNYNG